mmetsp:Transcript_102799/g.295990  ORF Transcript_102799/g.295990 Transcript_102799/m.295990 type:complete len:235 (-) Transcript_102799:7-711(-)
MSGPQAMPSARTPAAEELNAAVTGWQRGARSTMESSGKEPLYVFPRRQTPRGRSARAPGAAGLNRRCRDGHFAFPTEIMQVTARDCLGRTAGLAAAVALPLLRSSTKTDPANARERLPPLPQTPRPTRPGGARRCLPWLSPASSGRRRRRRCPSRLCAPRPSSRGEGAHTVRPPPGLPGHRRSSSPWCCARGARRRQGTPSQCRPAAGRREALWPLVQGAVRPSRNDKSLPKKA